MLRATPQRRCLTNERKGRWMTGGSAVVIARKRRTHVPSYEELLFMNLGNREMLRLYGTFSASRERSSSVDVGTGSAFR